MPSYTYEITCTCDEIGESPCPAQARENSLQNKNLALMAEIEEWKNATGLMDSKGDPDGVTPKDLYNEINHLRQQQEKQWGIADEARAAQYEKKIKRAIDILDIASGDTDTETIDYAECPMIHAMHVLLGIDKDASVV
jgi:hypothetical protein